MLPYRSCVVAVIQDESGRCLVGERRELAGAWQFPQGGVEAGENQEEAFFRELLEEIGSRDVKIMARAAQPIVYDFPPDMRSRLSRQFAGQSQTWFLARFLPGAGPVLEKGDGEFQAVAWLPASEVVNGVVAWKRRAYEQGLDALNVPWR